MHYHTPFTVYWFMTKKQPATGADALEFVVSMSGIFPGLFNTFPNTMQNGQSATMNVTGTCV